MERKASIMAMEVAIMAVVVLGLVRASAGAVYKVGDASGWTIVGNVNYSTWASTKSFHLGDVIHFEYNKMFHNVMEVSKNDFKACAATSPIATYTTGNDSIVIKRGGHHFFICGVPGHCSIGQKVDIRVPKRTSSAAPSIAPAASAPSTSAAAGAGTGVASNPAPSPHGNSAAKAASSMGYGLAISMLAFAATSLSVL
ncbi:mavicyanin-like [Typha latifolia]|uniref:mavicyanin-like n=1 Tax=Typha latifolia TaxID=4733 RepID=UPI003C2D9EC6